MNESHDTILDLHAFRIARADVVPSGSSISRSQVTAVLDALRIAIPRIETGFAADSRHVVWTVAGALPRRDVRAVAGLLSAAQIGSARPDLPPRYTHARGAEAAHQLLSIFTTADEPGTTRDRLLDLRRARGASDDAGTTGPILDHLFRTAGTVIRWINSNTSLGLGVAGAPDVVRVRNAATPAIRRLVRREAEEFERWLRDEAADVLRVHLAREIDALLLGDTDVIAGFEVPVRGDGRHGSRRPPADRTTPDSQSAEDDHR